MRRILVDHARKRQTSKRGGGEAPIPYDDAIGGPEKDAELVALDDALEAFAKVDPRATKIVELKQFGGLKIAEIGDVLDVSEATVKREWNFAKAWLKREIERRK